MLRCGAPASGMGRRSRCIHCRKCRIKTGRTRFDLPVQYRALQTPARIPFHRGASEEQLRQGAENRVAQAPIILRTMSRRQVILIADDSEDIRNLLGVMLKKQYDIKYAVNSDETLTSADTDPLPDLILLDVDMPS